jgi:hypothetical protein
MGEVMPGYQSKKVAALDEDGMYFVHHTQPTSLNGYIKKIEDLIQERDTWKALAQPAQERNFCSRCGKRTADLTVIHTCTPPQEIYESNNPT